MTVYYRVNILFEEKLKILDKGIKYVEWIAIDNYKNPFSLPSDQIAFSKLKERYLNNY